MNGRHSHASLTGAQLRSRALARDDIHAAKLHLLTRHGLIDESHIDLLASSPISDWSDEDVVNSRWGTPESAGRRYGWLDMGLGPIAPVTRYNPLDYDSGVTFDEAMAEIIGPRPED